MRKAFDKYLKDKEAAANKAVSQLSFLLRYGRN